MHFLRQEIFDRASVLLRNTCRPKIRPARFLSKLTRRNSLVRFAQFFGKGVIASSPTISTFAIDRNRSYPLGRLDGMIHFDLGKV